MGLVKETQGKKKTGVGLQQLSLSETAATVEQQEEEVAVTAPLMDQGLAMLSCIM